MVNYLGVNSVRELVRQVGLDRFLRQLVDAMDSDYRRWEQFDKSARHAIHSPVGVIELMPTSDGRLYCFKYVKVPGAGLLPPAGHPRAAPVRHRPRCQPQAGAQPGAPGAAGSAH